jgi:hypothetical protein
MRRSGRSRASLLLLIQIDVAHGAHAGRCWTSSPDGGVKLGAINVEPSVAIIIGNAHDPIANVLIVSVSLAHEVDVELLHSHSPPPVFATACCRRFAPPCDATSSPFAGDRTCDARCLVDASHRNQSVAAVHVLDAYGPVATPSDRRSPSAVDFRECSPARKRRLPSSSACNGMYRPRKGAVVARAVSARRLFLSLLVFRYFTRPIVGIEPLDQQPDRPGAARAVLGMVAVVVDLGDAVVEAVTAYEVAAA